MLELIDQTQLNNGEVYVLTTDDRCSEGPRQRRRQHTDVVHLLPGRWQV